MKKTFEKTLPEGYFEVRTVDAQSKKMMFLLNTVSVIIALGGATISVFLYYLSFAELNQWKCMMMAVLCLAYIVFHELTHGIAYKILTGEKLTFGLTLSVAYCGVPDIYVYRKPAMISLLAPFTVFGVIFAMGSCLLPLAIDRFISAVMLSIHIGGCTGDLYDAWLYLTEFRDSSVLMRDTGPKQIFYMKTTDQMENSDKCVFEEY